MSFTGGLRFGVSPSSAILPQLAIFFCPRCNCGGRESSQFGRGDVCESKKHVVNISHVVTKTYSFQGSVFFVGISTTAAALILNLIGVLSRKTGNRLGMIKKLHK